jgi:Zn-dependent peptidase ImmA (M78 family)
MYWVERRMVAMQIIQANFKRAQTEAEKLVKAYSFDTPPIDPCVIADDFGVNVRFVTFAEDFSNKVSGFFDYEEQTIFVNEAEHPNRQTFTIAHELGHKILHEEYLRSSDYKVLLRQSEIIGKKDPVEQEADAFASNLLVPNFLLKKYMDFATPYELSRLFIVSEAVIRNKLKYLRG